MVDVAQEVFTYLQDQYLVTFVISLIGGYSAVKTVAHGKRMSPVGFFCLGLVGYFLGTIRISLHRDFGSSGSAPTVQLRLRLSRSLYRLFFPGLARSLHKTALSHPGSVE